MTRSIGCLEYLPLKISRQIIHSISDLQSLRSLVHASAQLRHIYLTDRTLRYSAIDPALLRSALFAQTVSELDPGMFRPQWREAILRLLGSYKDDQTSVEHQIPTLSSLENMVHTQRAIEVLASDFHVWFQDSFIGPREDSSTSAFSFSPTEKLRVKRALYMYTIYSRLFEPVRLNENDANFATGGVSGSLEVKGRALHHPEKRVLFTSLFPRAHLDELYCTVMYTQARYTKYFSEIQEDQERDAEEDEDLRGTPSETGIEDLTPKGPFYLFFINTMNSLGPDFLYEVQQAASRSDRRKPITEQLSIQPDRIQDSLDFHSSESSWHKKWTSIMLDSETLKAMA